MKESQTVVPDTELLRREALLAGALDPASLRFRLVEYDKLSGELVGIPFEDLGFREAVVITADLIEARSDSRFCLQPIGFVQ